ncbi:LOW QUALITY PROTEIN: hypothetical protein J0S82_015440 [Galemys pyrenaicus]|uniref:Uncharacterized protein n=1 Tax=Galemys pyrenaicus TaxID=202257 RepID=A0A8J6AJV4_GALPY|nr:LOW QUALITY PROTEIN: hypothetical protein J0S82_015440 [Galemys pyrenaicus]
MCAYLRVGDVFCNPTVMNSWDFILDAPIFIKSCQYVTEEVLVSQMILIFYMLSAVQISLCDSSNVTDVNKTVEYIQSLQKEHIYQGEETGGFVDSPEDEMLYSMLYLELLGMSPLEEEQIKPVSPVPCTPEALQRECSV